MVTSRKSKKFILSINVALASMCALNLLTGCQQKPQRVYKVAYASPQTQASPAFEAGGTDSSDSAQWASMTSPVRQSVVANTHAAPTRLYHIGAGDVLEVRIQQLMDPEEESVQRVTVNQQGQIYLPVLNMVTASGSSVAQLRQDLTQRLGKEYIRNPEVDVRIVTYRSKEVIVLGMVQRPGSVFLQTDNAALLDVIGLAGGIQNEAAPNIEILRGAFNPGSAHNQNLTMSTWEQPSLQGNFKRDIVPVSRLFAEDGSQINPIIYPGDVVKLRNATEGFIYVSGQVWQPGAKPYRRPLTVLQAISVAGGFNKIAEERECKIIRQTPEGEELVFYVDYSKIESGEHRNVELAQNDLVMVPINPKKKFWNDVASLFHTGIRSGVDMSYNAASDMGIPNNGTGGF